MKLRVIILVAIAGLAACHRHPGNAPAVPAKPKAGVQAVAPSRGSNPQQSTAGMVEAVAQGKAQAPIDLKFDLLARPVQGQPFEVAIALLPQTAARSASVAVTGSDGLKIDPGEQQFEFPAIEAAQVYRHSIKVTPTTEGFYLLTLSVSLLHDQTSESRVFSVPILVGSAGAPGSTAPGSAPPGGGPGAHPADVAHRGS
jgi:hypothetical protein